MSVDNPTSSAASGTSEAGAAEISGESETDGTSEAGTAARPARAGSPVKAAASSGASEEAAGNSMVPPVGDSNGRLEPQKRGRGRPVGSVSRGKGGQFSQKPPERKFLLSREEAEIGWRMWKSQMHPAYNAAFGFFNRPLLTKEEIEAQHDAYVDFAMTFGDPLGKYAPIINGVTAMTMPVFIRIMPQQMGGTGPANVLVVVEDTKEE